MLCPADQTTLVMTERKGVEIDYCPTCRGVWLDRGELDKIIDRAAAEVLPPSATGLPGAAPAVAYPPTATPAPPAPAYGYDDRRDDRYREDRRDDRYRDDRYRDDHYRDHGYGHKKKRKESFLEDLFDF